MLKKTDFQLHDECGNPWDILSITEVGVSALDVEIQVDVPRKIRFHKTHSGYESDLGYYFLTKR